MHVCKVVRSISMSNKFVFSLSSILILMTIKRNKPKSRILAENEMKYNQNNSHHKLPHIHLNGRKGEYNISTSANEFLYLFV